MNLAEVTKALAVFEDAASQQNLQIYSSSGVLLPGHYSGYKALDAQLQNDPVFFLLRFSLPKGPNLHSLSSHL